MDKNRLEGVIIFANLMEDGEHSKVYPTSLVKRTPHYKKGWQTFLTSRRHFGVRKCIYFLINTLSI